ncbi:hypothetical protein [Sporomusa sp.]|uniref:hypothetical protein n=1 Tax=Sporomusa sp. TaxID=2078658 RepID=UPI002CBFC525|nr:hypothetical protein [Sporomusa sp.]HWR08040.1 hypothetical protein [Sporomusa sp.]
MKKVMFLLTLLLLITVCTALAAPINSLEKQQMAVGIVGGNVTNTYYLEDKVTNNLSIGIQYIDGDIDSYGKIDFSNNASPGTTPKLIIGNRDFRSGSTKYIGASVSAPMNEDFAGYAIALFGKSLQELQLGVTSELNESVFMNLNYRLVEHHGTKKGIGLGIGFRL